MTGALHADATLPVEPPFEELSGTGPDGFLMGDAAGRADERPVHRMTLDAFAIGTWPVTNSQYGAFFKDTSHHLPTEAQREFAARGGTIHRYPWGDAPLPLEGPFARGLAGAQVDRPLPATTPQRPGPRPSPGPNGYGLYYMADLVHEWWRTTTTAPTTARARRTIHPAQRRPTAAPTAAARGGTASSSVRARRTAA